MLVAASSPYIRPALAPLLLFAGFALSCGGNEPAALDAPESTGQTSTVESAPRVEESGSTVTASATTVEVAVPAGRQRALVLTIKDWLSAWSEQRVDDYLSSYSASFEPAGGISRRRWESERRQRVRAPRFLQVEMTALETELLGPDRARAEFLQNYRSDGYTDTVRKSLDLAWEGDRWRIVRESSEGAS